MNVNMKHHTVSVMSQIMESGTQGVKPEIGMPVTLNYYTDRRAAQITNVVSDKEIAVRNNQVKCVDYYSGDYEVLLNEFDGAEQTFTKRNNGRWVLKGDSADRGLGLSLGIHNHYIDPSF